MKSDELLRLLKKHGCKQVRQKESHKILRKEGVKSSIAVPYHRGKEVPMGYRQDYSQTSKDKMKTFRLVIEKAEDGYWGRISAGSDLITSFGNSIEDLKNNMREALKLSYEDKGKALPKYEYELVIDIQEFFTINNYINISTLAEHIGMNASLLRQYAKGIKYPSLKQVRRIENAVKEIGQQLIRTELQPN